MNTLRGRRAQMHAVGATIAVMAFAVGDAGCGDGADGQAGRVTTTPAEIRAEIHDDLPRIQAELVAGNGPGVCESLSGAGEIETVTSGIGRLTECADVVEWIAARGRRLRVDEKPWKVRAITLRDREAMVLAAAADGSSRYATFVETEKGEWKLDSLTALAPAALDNDPLGPGHDFSDPRGVSEKARVAEVVYDIEGDFPRGLGNSVCHELTPAGQRQIEQSAVGSGSCVDRIPEIAKRALAAGIAPRSSKVVSVQVDGRRATALLRDPATPPYRVDLELGSPDWKLVRITALLPIDDVLRP